MTDSYKELREKMFEILWDLMYASGGDGDSCLECENPTQVADKFEEWLNIHHPNFMRRYDGLLFIGNSLGSQESIFFLDITKENSAVSPWVEYLRISHPLIN